MSTGTPPEDLFHQTAFILTNSEHTLDQAMKFSVQGFGITKITHWVGFMKGMMMEYLNADGKNWKDLVQGSRAYQIELCERIRDDVIAHNDKLRLEAEKKRDEEG